MSAAEKTSEIFMVKYFNICIHSHTHIKTWERHALQSLCFRIYGSVC